MGSPNPPVLVYDGDCAFCTRSAKWIAARLPSGVTVAPSQTLDLATLGLKDDEVAAAAWWVETDGRRHRGAAAIGHALRATGGGWGLAGRVMLTPPLSWLAGPVYEWVARNRQRMPGGTAACSVDDRPAD